MKNQWYRNVFSFCFLTLCCMAFPSSAVAENNINENGKAVMIPSKMVAGIGMVFVEGGCFQMGAIVWYFKRLPT